MERKLSRGLPPEALIGAVEIIRECQQLQVGERQEFTPLADYVAPRRRYWQTRGQRLPLRRRAALPRRRFA